MRQQKKHNAITKLILKAMFKNKKIGLDKSKKLSDYVIAKGYYNFKILAKQRFRDIVFIIAGILCAAFGLESFLIPNHFVDGGATGISLLIAGETQIPLYIILTVINIPFMIMGSKIVGKAFAIKTSCAIVVLSFAVAYVHFPEVTH